MTTETSELIADIREQILYMQELGVESLGVGLLVESGELIADGRKPTVEESPKNFKFQISNFKFDGSNSGDILTSEIKRPSDERREAGSLLASLPSLKDRPKGLSAKNTKALEAEPPRKDVISEESVMKIDEAAPIETVQKIETAEEVKADSLFDSASVLPEPTETVEQIRADIGANCTRCKLSTLGRKQVVNSVGNFNADLMFVGEAPGADEDQQGEPFVGRAGQLLTDIIEKGLEMPRSEVFIGNINRCRPPGNRAPETDESSVCKPFLLREIAVVRPKVIVVLGATAAQNLLETKVPISKLRGQFHDYLGVKVMPTFHPAYLLRDPHKKREVWEDMKMVKAYLTAENSRLREEK